LWQKQAGTFCKQTFDASLKICYFMCAVSPTVNQETPLMYKEPERTCTTASVAPILLPVPAAAASEAASTRESHSSHDPRPRSQQTPSMHQSDELKQHIPLLTPLQALETRSQVGVP
jgi:hypothetical protein